MPLDPKQRRFLTRFFQGLVEAVEELGPGDFGSDPPIIKSVGPYGVRHAELSLNYALHDGTVVRMKTQPKLRRGMSAYQVGDDTDLTPVDLTHYEPDYYSFHYGTAAGVTRFRYDFNQWRGGHHVHIPPDTGEHVPATSVEPDTTNMDPRVFVAHVAKLKTEKVLSVKRKKR